MKKLTLILLIIASVMVTSAFAATYTVKTDGNGNFSTIQACADKAQPGDTCLVSSGTYSGFTARVSGAAGKRITFAADPNSSQPKVSSLVNFANQSYITVKGFELQKGVIGSGCRFIEIKNNKVTNTDIGIGGGSNALNGTDILLDGNIFGDRGDDVFKGNGDRWVIRNNIATGINDTLDEHIDFYQNSCANLPGDFVLIENNIYADITGSNTHFFLLNCSSGRRTNHIIRFNKVRDLGSNAVTFDDSAGGTGFDGATVYNNTFMRVIRGSGTRTYAISAADVDTGMGAQNNLYYDSINPKDARGATPASNNCDGSLVYDPDSSITLNDCLRNARGVVVNQDPRFVDAARNNFALQAGSPAIDKGYHLTQVASADDCNGGTSCDNTMVVGNSYYFQPGWAGAEPDWIAVGTVSNVAQITAINYTTNTITLATPISRSAGDRVYLYKNSSGTRVLLGSAPDIGAVEYGAATETPGPVPTPTNLQIVDEQN